MTAGERQPLTADERDWLRTRPSAIWNGELINGREIVAKIDLALARAVTAEAALADAQKELNERRMMTDKIGPGLLLAGSSPAAEAETCDHEWATVPSGEACRKCYAIRPASGVSDTREGGRAEDVQEGATANAVAGVWWRCPACQAERADCDGPAQHLDLCPNCGSAASPVPAVADDPAPKTLRLKGRIRSVTRPAPPNIGDRDVEIDFRLPHGLLDVPANKDTDE